jgi:death on curing protein
MIKYLTLDEVLEMHDIFIEKFGGLPGVRDQNLLLSVIEAPKAAMFGDDLYPTVFDKGVVSENGKNCTLRLR